MKNAKIQIIQKTLIKESATITDVLNQLINESDLIEVVSCLDAIATESKRRVELFGDGIRIYPA